LDKVDANCAILSIESPGIMITYFIIYFHSILNKCFVHVHFNSNQPIIF
jgi:hypothetical protein